MFDTEFSIDPSNTTQWLAQKCPTQHSDGMCEEVEALLSDRYQDALQDDESFDVELFSGEGTAFLRAQLGTSNKAHVFELYTDDFATDPDEALALLLDYLDGILDTFFQEDRDAYLPLNFTKRNFDAHTLWVRHEFRNYQAEMMADEFLQRSLLQ